MRSKFGLVIAFLLAILGVSLVILPTIAGESDYQPITRSQNTDPNMNTPLLPLKNAPPRRKPAEVAHTYYRVPPPPPIEIVEEPQEEPEPEKPPEPTSASWITPLGTVVDNADISWLYFKNKRSGKLIRVRQDGLEEAGCALIGVQDTDYVLSLNGELLLIQGRTR